MAPKILVIEDETHIRENVAALLTLKGYAVATAPNGREGLLQAIVYLPDLILCDIRMPEMDGYQLLEAIRNNRSLATVPFIFLTAKTEETDLRRGMVLGADDYLTKPFTLDSLLQSIESRLQREAQREADLQSRLGDLRRTINSVSSHEYNTPLTCILGFVSLLMDHSDEFDQSDRLSMLAMIKSASLRLKRSLDNLRLLEELHQVDTLPSAFTFFSTGSSWIDTNVVKQHIQKVNDRQDQPLTCRLEIERAHVTLSETSLGTVIEELVDNAHKFSDGTQPVQISGHQGELTYQLRISNHGQLFKPEDIARIAPYMQFDRKTYEQQGSGLGLAIVKKLLALNKGSLVIESQLTGETSVIVTLPSVLE
ncbi:response regulator [Spirosoma sp. HMF4905]|uniref:histidine kinase n=1 Tax=Spirosoma arboris TaxID=2682092 RepID=A0A7K1S8K8_9BACT|nr:response regulator [Spirosoma arboris]MVM30154.1 response regulator [Spirosoma arboris]